MYLSQLTFVSFGNTGKLYEYVVPHISYQNSRNKGAVFYVHIVLISLLFTFWGIILSKILLSSLKWSITLSLLFLSIYSFILRLSVSSKTRTFFLTKTFVVKVTSYKRTTGECFFPSSLCPHWFCCTRSRLSRNSALLEDID